MILRISTILSFDNPVKISQYFSMNMVTIEKVAGYDRAELKSAMIRLLEPLGGMGKFVKPGERVLLKPNMLSAKPPEAAVTTHPEVLRAAIELVQDAGGIPLVGDSPGVGRFKTVAQKSGMLAMILETGAELVGFEDSLEATGSGMFKRFELARPYLEADRIINLPKLKTHEMMTMTCAVKNLFGAVVGAAKAEWHLKAGADREIFARMLLEIYLLRKPDLNIVDAIIAMEGNGPGGGDPRHVGLLLAGVNPVAVDVIAGEITCIPKKLLYVERSAVKLGIDGANRDTIQIRGIPVEEAKVDGFRLPHISDVQWGIPPFLKNRLRHCLTSRPYAITEKCRLCGICRDACPPHAITIRNGALHFDYHRCIRCFCCRELCPDGALEIKEGTLLRLIKKYV
jgi:uncharacterized protein (DUF362 family)/Pyruvate/2-oxoacid:ferredoxin oxidoreductase delta subunit